MTRRSNWTSLENYAGHEVSDQGEIRNAKSRDILKTSVNQTGVRYVSIRNTVTMSYENKALSVLMAETFLGMPNKEAETVLHLDGDISNASANNLRWSTRYHAMAFHREIDNPMYRIRRRIQDENGRIYSCVQEASHFTGDLPSAIDYTIRYNDNMAQDTHANFIHKTHPGGHIFKSA